MFTIDQRSSTPIYQQLVQEIKEAILKGALQPGDRLPSVRELSVQLTINPNTVQKSYQELERQKIIENLRGKGTYVSADYKPCGDQEQLTLLREELRRLLIEAHYLGLDEEKITEMVGQLLAELSIGEGDS